MGQYWMVIAPHDRIMVGSWGKLGEFLFSSLPNTLVKKLTVPETDWIDEDGPKDKPSKIRPPVSKLEALPHELQDMILSYLDHTEILFLSATSVHLWRLFRHCLKPFYTDILSPLAGKALVCVGDYVKDYPEGLLTPAQEAELAAGLESSPGMPVNLYSLASERYKRLPRNAGSLSDFCDLLGPSGPWPSETFHSRDGQSHASLMADATRTWPKHERSQAMKLAAPAEKDFYPPGLWVLRNLTTREYVTDDYMGWFEEDRETTPGSDEGFEQPPEGLGEVVMARICWSSDPSRSMNYSSDITRGKWAGDCFDIVKWERMLKEGGMWSDATEEVAREIKDIWESEFGR